MRKDLVTLREDSPVWHRVFAVNPPVVVGTEEGAAYDLAPKRMAMPMGWENYFGFVCTLRHRSYQNTRRESVSTISYPRPTQVVLASLAASPREDDRSKLAVDALPTFRVREVDGALIEDAYLFFECVLDRVADNFGENSLIVGRIVATHARADYLRTSERDDQDVIHCSHLLAYLNPERYTSIGESYSFPFPAGFMR